MGDDNNMVDFVNCFRLNGNTLTVKPKRTLLFDTTEYTLHFIFSNRQDQYTNNKPSYFYANRLIYNILNTKQRKLVNRIEQRLKNIECGNYKDLSPEQKILMKARQNDGLFDGIKVPYNFVNTPVEIEDKSIAGLTYRNKPIPEVHQVALEIKGTDIYVPKSTTQPVIDRDKLEILDPERVNLYNCRHRSLIPKYRDIEFNSGPEFIPIFRDENYDEYGYD